MEIVPRSALFRQIPPVDELLRNQAVATLISSYGHEAVVGGCRLVLEQLRREIASGMNETALTQALVALPETVEATLRESSRPSLRPVINATGVILHTNLGRAPLAESALRHALEVARGYSNLEFDLERGERGRRDVHVERLFSELFVEIEPTRAQATATPPPEQNVDRVRTVIVNNNAAAVMLALNTLADGGEVIVSRGELVEIGGSFRIPDVMSKSGAILREVGTTNRTRIGDYERAINERTKLLLRVHRSNFKIIGFTEQPSVEELVALGRKCQIPVLEDLGSGALFPLEEIGISGEPTVFSSLRAGVDVITYSGDKLLGGPQAGILSGRAELIARIRSNPLFRALRVDKLIYSVLETTLLAYVRRQYDAVPALRMMRVSAQEL